MLKHNQYCNLLKCRLCRLPVLLLLVLFTLYPILDAYEDSFSYSPVKMDVSDDSVDASKRISRGHHALNTPIIDLFLPTSTINENSAFTISRREIPSHEIKCYHSCSPLSSDPSPPPFV